jgi:hypothetical protein
MPRKSEANKKWRLLHKEEFYTHHFVLLGQMEKGEMHKEFWWGNLIAICHLQDQKVDGMKTNFRVVGVMMGRGRKWLRIVSSDGFCYFNGIGISTSTTRRLDYSFICVSDIFTVWYPTLRE